MFLTAPLKPKKKPQLLASPARASCVKECLASTGWCLVYYGGSDNNVWKKYQFPLLSLINRRWRNARRTGKPQGSKHTRLGSSSNDEESDLLKQYFLVKLTAVLRNWGLSVFLFVACGGQHYTFVASNLPESHKKKKQPTTLQPAWHWNLRKWMLKIPSIPLNCHNFPIKPAENLANISASTVLESRQ